MNWPSIISEIRGQYKLDWHGVHGIGHWARVYENGMKLAELTGASPTVVQLFAVFHDACRLNENWDPEHGRRGAAFAASLRGDAFELADAEFALLTEACELHADGLMAADLTVQTCWDADRLDLGRVGICPEPSRLCTETARDHRILFWANSRAWSDSIPEFVGEVWDERRAIS